MNKLLFFIPAILLSTAVHAYRINWGKSVTISQPVYEDLYVAGGTVTINAPVYGDLIVAGGTIYINDTVANDLLLAGGTVYINGYIADDVRCAGGELVVTKNISGDLVITGGKVRIGKDVVIGGGLMTSGGEVVADGIIYGDVKSASGRFTFNGQAHKNFESRSEKLVMNGGVMGAAILAAREIHIGPDASFSRDVRYWSKSQQVNFGNSLKGGKAVYDPSLKITGKNWYFLGFGTVVTMIWYLATIFLFMLLLEYLFGSLLKKAGGTVEKAYMKSMGLGLLFFIGVPVVIFFLLITLIGIPVGLIIMLAYIILVALATVITSLVIANWYSRKFNRNWNYWQMVGYAFLIFLVVKLVSLMPFLGWLVMIMVASIAFGAILKNINWKRRPDVSWQQGVV